MKASDVTLKDVFLAKVSGVVVPVSIDRCLPGGEWLGTNLRTGHSIVIKTAARLRCRCNRDGSTVLSRMACEDIEARRTRDMFPFQYPEHMED